jgi:hypothetical protein
LRNGLQGLILLRSELHDLECQDSAARRKCGFGRPANQARAVLLREAITSAIHDFVADFRQNGCGTFLHRTLNRGGRSCYQRCAAYSVQEAAPPAGE